MDICGQFVGVYFMKVLFMIVNNCYFGGSIVCKALFVCSCLKNGFPFSESPHFASLSFVRVVPVMPWKKNWHYLLPFVSSQHHIYELEQQCPEKIVIIIYCFFLIFFRYQIKQECWYPVTSHLLRMFFHHC